MLIIVMIADIIRAIKIIEFMLAPTQMIISGPKATFGNEFKIVKYGSNTLARKGFHQRMVAHPIPMIVAKKKLRIVS